MVVVAVLTSGQLHASKVLTDTTDIYLFYGEQDSTSLHYYDFLLNNLNGSPEKLDSFACANYHGMFRIILPNEQKAPKKTIRVITENRYGMSILEYSELKQPNEVLSFLNGLHVSKDTLLNQHEKALFFSSGNSTVSDTFLMFYSNTLITHLHNQQHNYNIVTKKTRETFRHFDHDNPEIYLNHYLSFARYFRNIFHFKGFQAFYNPNLIFEIVPDKSFFNKNKSILFRNDVLHAELKLFTQKDVPQSEALYETAMQSKNEASILQTEIELIYLLTLAEYYTNLKYPLPKTRRIISKSIDYCEKFPQHFYSYIIQSSYLMASTFPEEPDSMSYYLFYADNFINQIDFPTNARFEGETQRLKYEIGTYYFKLGDYEKAEEYLKQFDVQKYFDFQLHFHKNTYLGKIYASQGNYQKAISFFKDCQNYMSHLDPFNFQWYKVSNLFHIGTTFLKSGNHQEGIDNLNQALSITNNLLKSPDLKYEQGIYREKFRILLALSEYYNSIGQFNKADELSRDLEFYDLVDKTRFIDLFLLRAKIFRNLNRKSAANKSLDKALRQANLVFKDRHASKAAIYIEMARTNQEDHGIEFYNNALTQLLDSLGSFEKLHQNDIANCQSKTLLLTALHEKGKLMTSLNNAAPGTFQKTVIQDCYFSAINVIRQIRNQYNNDIDKEWLVSNFADIYDNALDLAYEIYLENPKNETQKANCFLLAEASKSNSLYEALTSNQAKRISGIPDSMIQEGKNMQLRLAQLEAKSDKAPDNAVLKANIFQLKNKRDSFELLLENNFPEYKNQKYALDHVKIENLQALLSRQDAQMLEYFIGKKHIYIFSISDTNFALHQIANDTLLEHSLHQFIELCQSRIENNAEINQFRQLGKQLYDTLVANFIQPQKRLLIVPDGLLTFLPFELLIREAKETRYWKNIDFLIKHKIINYAYSSSVYQTNMKPDVNGVTKKGILAFAPISFERHRRDSVFLDTLSATANILESLKSNFDALGFERKYALKSTFLDQINNNDFNIINLLTHADVTGQPHIYFYDEKLLLNELYRLNINTNLMILTACKTGVGKYKKGEGAMSLARGCSYANVPAVVKSLWSLREDSSAEIIYSFHKFLKQGLPKDQALQKSKLEFLEKHGHDIIKTQPSRWAGMVSIGNNAPIYHKPKFRPGLLLFSLILLLPGGLFFYKKWSKKSAA